MGAVADEASQKFQLVRLGTTVQGQVRHHHQQAVGLLAKAGNQGAAARDATGQTDLAHVGGSIATEQAHAVPGPTAQTPVHTGVPVREVRLIGQIGHLVDVIAAQAAGIGFLQRDQIIRAQNVGDAVQVFMP